MSFKTLLLQTIVKAWYGPCAMLVVCVLMSQGETNARNIRSHSNLNLESFQCTLIALIKHGIVSPVMRSEANGRSILCYSLNENAILHLLRRGKYLHHISELYGEAGFYIALELTKSGMIIGDDLIATAKEHADTHCAGLVTPQSNVTYTLEYFTTVYSRMYLDGVIMNCSTMERIIEQSEPATPNAARKIATAFQSSRKKTESQDRSTNTPSRTKVKRATSDIRNNFTTNPFAHANFSYEVSEWGLPPQPRVEPAFNNTPETKVGDHEPVSIDKKAVVRLNIEKLNLELTKVYVETFISIRWGNAILVRLIARSLLQELRKVDSAFMAPDIQFDVICLRVTQIARHINADPKTVARLPDYDSDTIYRTLENMIKHPDTVIKINKRDSGNGYYVDWNLCVQLMVRRCVHSMISTRLGPEAARVYELVLDVDGKFTAELRQLMNDKGTNDTSAFLGYRRLWNDAEVSEMALLPINESRRYLNQLTLAGFIISHNSDVVGVPLATATAASHRQGWLFGANVEHSREALLNLIFKYALNICERQAVEVNQIQNIALRVGQLTIDEENEMISKEIAEDVLEGSINGLDQIIMLCNEM